MINKVLNNRYKIIELIGRGGMAYVYKAKDLKLNRFVAVKVLREEYTENEQFIKKFDRESQAAAGLSHPNIVSVYDVGVEGDIYYIIMEYVDGITLKQYLDKHGYLDYREATQFIIDVATALKCAHDHKIIHRDIKPHNILLTQTNMPKVADFGIARAITSSTVTMTNQTMGSVHYISPEQARGGFVDERSDLYSLGIMYYELLTGHLPFDEESTVAIAIKHIQDTLNPPKNLVEDIPQSVNDVVVKLTNKKPEDRYQSCEELIEDLQKIMKNPNALVADSEKNALLEDTTQVIGGDSLFKIEPTTSIPGELLDDKENEDLEEELTASRKKKNKKKVWIGIGAAVLVLIAIIIAVNFSGSKTVSMPDLKGMTREQAEQTLSALELQMEVEGEVYSADVEAGKIAEQNPVKNTEVEKGKSIKVKLSKGPETVVVPDLIGKTEKEATAALEQAKLSLGEVKREYRTDVAEGTVYDVDPGPGNEVTAGSKIVLYVSRGRDLVDVPDVRGLSESEARSKIENAGLTVGTITSTESNDYPSGQVCSQSVSGGTQTDRGTEINLVISTGKPQPTPTPSPSADPEPSPSPSPSAGDD